MKGPALRMACGMALAVMTMPVVHAQQGAKALPTLLIKGDIVSLDRTDPAATLLTVKDRYGFETPIYLSAETAISGGEPPASLSTLSAGTTVEIEYNFDVNTAKRHAVTVRVAEPPAPVAEEAAPAEAAEATTPEAEPMVVEEAMPAEPAEAEPAAPIEEPAESIEGAAPAEPAEPVPMPEAPDAATP